MDREVAQTLGELERKLAQLERTLNAIRTEDPSHVGASAQHEVPAAAPSHGASRIVDESFEPAQTEALPAAPAHVEPTARAPQPRSRTPRWSSRAPAPPSAAELLRFRERLERAARELTHEYDELLGTPKLRSHVHNHTHLHDLLRAWRPVA